MTPSVLLLLLSMLSSDVVVLRGGDPSVRGSVSRVDDDGVRIGVEGEPAVVIPWDRISGVNLSEERIPRLEEHLSRGVDLWRARTRLERGDFALAEPIFEVQFPGTLGRTSETALVVAEGLLRCRLHRGELAAALLPALEVARLRRKGIETRSYADLLPPAVRSDSPELIQMLDVESGLVPYIPPAWLSGPDLAARLSAIESWDSGGDDTLSLLAELYAMSIRQSMGESIDPVELAEPRIADSFGGLLLAAMINSLHDDVDVRKSARSVLETSLSGSPPWVEGWIRFQLGRSLLMEPAMGQQRRGLLSLAHLPARWGRSQPYLSGVAMAMMADQFRAHGRPEDAKRLRSDLRRMHPAHPVLRRGVEARLSFPEEETQ
ncbi:MAG: hypothetical protein CMJ24_03715 [Phycisphaerae bacterium]|nr:hypothetical protein [Phycisphaerae bacterium]